MPGHGGRDPGFQIGAEQEKKYTLLLAQELRRRLMESGLKVVMLRDSDRSVSHEERTLAAKRRHADVYVSLHYNSAGPQASEVRGAEVYCLTLPGSPSTNGGTSRPQGLEPGDTNKDKNVLLAYLMQKSLVRNLGTTDPGCGVRGSLCCAWRRCRRLDRGRIHVQSRRDETHQGFAHRKRTAQAIVEVCWLTNGWLDR
jgi:N-acetylmuramoyl-L-alanine amidase